MIEGAFDQLEIRRLRHRLADHPLLSTESLAKLALRMNPEFVRFHDGERRFASRLDLHTDPSRHELRHAIDNLHKRSAFVQILNVREDPEYRQLVDEVLDAAAPHLPARDRVLINRDAAVFLASPGSTTPFHLDHEQNFLCHIRGAKTFHVWDHRDRSLVGEQALEVFYGEGKARDLVYEPAMQAKAHTFELAPGDCIYMPMGSPHAVTTGKDITVTISILMNTLTAFDTVEAYRANYMMRRMGLSPRPVGDNETIDSLKRHTVGAVRRVRNLARGRKTERRLQWY
jgi:ribosomal protein L16 Arg81 hydroxylase